MRSAFRGPAHQLAVRMHINNCTHGHNNNNGPSNQPCTMRQQLRVRRGFAHFSAFIHYCYGEQKTILSELHVVPIIIMVFPRILICRYMYHLMGARNLEPSAGEIKIQRQ